MSASCDISKLLDGLKQHQSDVHRKAGIGMVKAMTKIIGDAQILAPEGGGKYSPNDPAPGALRDSATVEPLQDNGSRMSIQGGFHTVYAARQHEELTWRHSNGQAKFLETAVRANQHTAPQIVRDEIAK